MTGATITSAPIRNPANAIQARTLITLSNIESSGDNFGKFESI